MLVVGAAATGASAKSHARHVIATPATLPLRTGLLDPLFAGPDRQQAFTMAAATGATYVRLSVEWRAIAPAAPPTGFVATDPTSAGYNWTGLDSIAGQLDAAGLTPIFDIASVPEWAYATQPKAPNAGTPTASDLRDFATALATHYDGSTPGVPAEHVFQVWNEPNLSLNLNPVAPNAYRGLVNAVADAVHAVDPANLVVAGGLDPFGHKKKTGQKWYSTAPLAYMRSLLCLSKGAHPHATCNKPVHFDVWSHHPYTFGGPFGHAKNPDDVELGDLPKMRTLLTAGKRLHHIVSARSPQFWVTEFGWDTNPPRRHAASLNLASRWTAESLHQMWLSGVSLVTWFLLEDYQEPEPVSERPLLPHDVARQRAPEAGADRVPLPVRRVSRQEERHRLGPRRDEHEAARHRPAGAPPGRAVADGGVAPRERLRDLQGDPEAQGDEEGLAAGDGARFRQVPRLLADRAARSAHRPLG